MKRKFFAAYLLPLCFLCGCGDRVGLVSYSSDDTISVMATLPAETTTTPTEPATEKMPVKSVPHEDAVLKVLEEIEVYEKLTLSELLAETNVNLENGDEIVDTSETGSFEITVSYTYEDELYEHPLSYTVSDTTAPVLLNSGWNPYIERGDAFDLNDYVGFADNYDSNPTLTYTGYVDTNICGVYPLTATAADSSGNAVSWDLNINVVETIPVPEDNNPRLAFSDFTQQYAGDNVKFGIDVSTWQGDIDFEAVKNAGCSFVIMRIGYYYDEIKMDDWFVSNMAEAKAAGLDVGVYIYTTANTEEEVRENASWIADNLDGQKLDFPVAFDWENFTNFQKYEMSIHDLNTYFEIFADEMEQYGYSAMLYSSKNFLNNFWYDHSDEYPVWLAHYTDQTDYTGEYNMWQMSCYGRINGIAGDVDLNILYTDEPLN